MRLHAATTRKYLLFISLSLICLHNPNSASYSNAQWKVFSHASILSFLFFYFYFFRNEPVWSDRWDAVDGSEVDASSCSAEPGWHHCCILCHYFGFIWISFIDSCAVKSSNCSRRAYMRLYVTCFVSRWVWEQRGWVSLTPHRYRTSTSLQASFLGPVQDLVLVLVPLVWISQEHRMLCMR